MKKFIIVAVSFLAMATAWADDEVVVKWQMGDNTVGYATPATAATNIKYTVGSGLKENGTSTFDDMTYTKFEQNTGDEYGKNGDHDGNMKLGKYIDFTFTPAGDNFTPLKVSFNIVKYLTSYPTCDVDVIDGKGNTLTVASNAAIVPHRDARDGVSTLHSYDLSEASASSGAVTLRIIIGNLLSQKSIDIANVVIEGVFRDAASTFYGAVSADGKTFTIYYDTKQSDGDLTIDQWTSSSQQTMRTNVETIVLDETVFKVFPTSTAHWFENFTNATSIEHLDYLRTSSTTDMTSMFAGCSSLTTLDVNSFAMNKVTNTTKMFYGCSALTTIYCDKKWADGAVTESADMFGGCTSLVGGKGSTYNATKTDIAYAHPDGGNDELAGYFTMKTSAENEIYATLSADGLVMTLYYDDVRIAHSDAIDEWTESSGNSGTLTDITKVVLDESMKNAKPSRTSHWFQDMHSLQTIEHIDYLNTESVHFMRQMFSGCSALKSVDVTGFDTHNVQIMTSMFDGCSSLETLDVNGFTTDNVRDMSYMFRNCSSLTTIYCGNDWGYSYFYGEDFNSTDMFSGCTSLVGGYGATYNENYTDVTYANPGAYFTDNSTHEYTVTFLDKDGNTLKTETVEEGDAAVAPEAPEVEGFVFDGWDTDYSNVTSDLTVTAQYIDLSTQPDELYFDINGTTITVRFDNLILSRKLAFVWEAMLPSKERNSATKIVIDPSVSNTTITTLYNSFANMPALGNIEGLKNINTTELTDVSFMFMNCTALTQIDLNGFDLSGITSAYGMFMNCSALTTILCDADYTALAGASSIGMFDGCTSLVGGKGTTYVKAHNDASYARPDRGSSAPGYFTGNVPEIYTVTFLDKDGNTLKTESVEDGTAATAPEAPAVAGYEFKGWEPADFSSVKADMTVKAQYEVLLFSVIFVDKDGNEIKKETVDYGKVATAPEAPIVEGYEFKGWDIDFSNVKSDLTVKAQYEILQFTVVFVDLDEKELSKQTVDWGKSATAPADPVREGYTFIGWEPADFSQVKSDMTVTAQYSKDAVVYTVTFVDWDDSEILAVKVLEGEDAKAPTDPVREGYEFIGWGPADFTNVHSNLTVKAQYEVLHFSVVFVDKDGKELKTETVDYGKAATAPEAPAVEGYEFKGWDVDFSNVKSDLTVKAQYKEVEAPNYTPQNLKAEVVDLENQDQRISLSWDAVKDVLTYEVQLLYNGLPLYTVNTLGRTEMVFLLSELLKEINGIEPGTYALDWQVRSTDEYGEAISEWADGEHFEVVVPLITGLENVGTHPSADGLTADQAVKVLRNGRVYILRNGEIYTTDGQRVR